METDDGNEMLMTSNYEGIEVDKTDITNRETDPPVLLNERINTFHGSTPQMFRLPSSVT